MKQLIKPENQKFVIVFVAALVAFGGLEVASQVLNSYQIGIFFRVGLMVYAFLVFWQSFVFDLELRPAATLSGLERSFLHSFRDRFSYLIHGDHWLHYQNYLVLPGIIYWSAIVLLYLRPFEQVFKQFVIIGSAMALSVAFWYLKTTFYRHHEASRGQRQSIFLVKVYASFVAYAAALGIIRYFGFGVEFFSILIFGITFLLLYQALFQHHSVALKSVMRILATSLILSGLAYVVFFIWNVNYYSAALALTAFYNTAWGFIHHKYIDRDLTREIFLEYVAVLILVLVIIFSTTNFAERI